jgi:hypothetical protein
VAMVVMFLALVLEAIYLKLAIAFDISVKTGGNL